MDLHHLLAAPPTLSPLEALFTVLSLLVVLSKFKESFRGITIFIQLMLLFIRMAKHYLDTHPEARKYIDDNIERKINVLYRKHILKRDINRLRSKKETGAAG